MSIGSICRAYRMASKISLANLGQDGQRGAKLLSAFEQGKSSNIKHLETYMKLADSNGDLPYFLNQLAEEVINNA